VPEQPKKPEAEKPLFDPHKLLGQLEGIMRDNKNPTKGGGKSWVGTLVILAVVLVGVAIWSWISWRRGRELAKLRHEKTKAKVAKEKAELEKKLSKNMVTVIEAGKRIEEAEEKLKIIEADMRAEEARYEADLRAIDNIRSWRDAGIQ
jgi:uncharacterized protein HemX